MAAKVIETCDLCGKVMEDNDFGWTSVTAMSFKVQRTDDSTYVDIESICSDCGEKLYQKIADMVDEAVTREASKQ